MVTRSCGNEKRALIDQATHSVARRIQSHVCLTGRTAEGTRLCVNAANGRESAPPVGRGHVAGLAGEATRGSMVLLHCGPQIPICLNVGLEHDCCASINSRRAACAGIYLKGELRLIASSVWIGSMQDSCIARHERSPWRNSGLHLPCLRGISRTRRLRGPDGDDQSSLRAATACNSLQGRIRTATRSQRSRAMPRPRQVACEPPT